MNRPDLSGGDPLFVNNDQYVGTPEEIGTPVDVKLEGTSGGGPQTSDGSSNEIKGLLSSALPTTPIKDEVFDPKGGWNTVKRKSGYSSNPERKEISLSSFRDMVGKAMKFPDWFASLTGGPKAPNNPVRNESEAPAVRVSTITVSDNADDDSDDGRRYYGTEGDHEDAMRKLSKGALGSRYEAPAPKLMSQVEIDYSSGHNVPPGMSGSISQALMKNEEKEPRKER